MKGIKYMNKFKKNILCRILLVLICLPIVLLVLKYLPYIIQLTVSLDKFRDYIISLGNLGPIALILFQILQTVIAPIPGEVIQVAGGYVYGTTLGAIYLTIGMLIGAIIAFYFARFMGRTFIEKLLQKQNAKWMKDIIDSKKFSFILFIIFLVPGLPKDFLIYAAGLTNIKASRFFSILLLGRFPWLLASICIGSNIHHGHYRRTIIISLLALISLGLGLLFKDKLISKFSHSTIKEDCSTEN